MPLHVYKQLTNQIQLDNEYLFSFPDVEVDPELGEKLNILLDGLT